VVNFRACLIANFEKFHDRCAVVTGSVCLTIFFFGALPVTKYIIFITFFCQGDKSAFFNRGGIDVKKYKVYSPKKNARPNFLLIEGRK